MNNSLIALVTGAARGIGYACAEAISETGAFAASQRRTPVFIVAESIRSASRPK